MALLSVMLLAILAGGVTYCVLVVFAARHYLSVRPPELRTAFPISVLKPLAGLDEGLEQNLRSFFELDYPEFELLFAVSSPDDPAIAVVEKSRQEHPHVAARLIVTGEPPYPNAKVYSLDRMLAEARNELLVMSDSDIRVKPDMLRVVAAEFQDQRLGVATCPYRAVPGQGIWSRLEALGMNTEFLAGVLVARLIEGMRFAVGPTIVARKAVLASIGGFDQVKDYLSSEDFMLGKLASEHGWRVILSSYVIEHRIGSQGFKANALHRLRWGRTTRRSRPSGYLGQLFTNPLPLALLLIALKPDWWPVLALTALFRALAAWAVAGWVLHDPLAARRWWLVPVQDVVSFCFWLAGFFGNTIEWRGRPYHLRADGRFEPRG
jgi:ceramide glucosyltransferase